MPVVRLLAGLRDRAGASRFESQAASVGALLAELSRRGGDTLREPLDSVDLRVLVNGRSIQFLDGLDTALAADDVVTLHLAGARGFPGG